MFKVRLFSRALVAVAIGSLALPSCNGGSAIPNAPGATQPGTQLPSFRHPIEPNGAATALYVSDWFGKSVFRFTRNADGTLVTPAGSSLVLSYNPGPIAIGVGGNLYVTDEDAQ